MAQYPEIIESTEQLDEVMTGPSTALVEFLGGLSGRLVVLGAGGKMGPSLCIRAARAVRTAAADLAVVGVSRFSNPATPDPDKAGRASPRQVLESAGVATIACDLMNPDEVAALPDADHVIFLVGWKFGTTSSPGRTWTVNTLVPSLAANRYRDARIVALSSGNVYPFVTPDCGGADESYDPSPVGEYAWSCLGRERVFQYWSDVNGSPIALVRLNYAVDLRYGVLVDLASTIQSGKSVDLTTGFLNCVWQGDANDLIIRSLGLAASPTALLNLTGPAILRVRDLAEQLADRMELPVHFTGSEAETALLNDSGLLHSLLGTPEVEIDQMVRWTAHWMTNDMPLAGKATHFAVRDGKF